MKKYHSREERDRKLTVRSYVIAATIGIGLVIITALGIRYYISQTRPQTQVTSVDKDKWIKAYEKRKKYITDRLNKFREANRQQLKEELEAEAERMMSAAESEDLRKHIDYVKGVLLNINDRENISFWEGTGYTPNGKEACAPTTGLLFFINNPALCSDPAAVTDNTIMLRIQRMASRADIPDLPANLMIYNYAMRYVYDFFKGSINKSDLDEAIQEIMKSDDPDFSIVKNFKGRDYTFKYDREIFGTITIEFKID